ncbi:siderophore-interacting protein [Arthrobacter sp. B6]|uniref:siderophore-interacting protein n=1 Tax=Arthrobacter sp. B6 TaxID=1570137 RepID=UPI000833D135|nr:siderophore-interacting protein [Arthrobacter sp. B6]
MDKPAVYPLRVFGAAVVAVRELSPHFRRITFAGADLAAFGVPGPRLDLRIKLLLPVPGHALLPLGGPGGRLDEGWYQEWLRRDQPGRGVIRSYTVRALRTAQDGAELDVDFVHHPTHDGVRAPASDWARAATAGTPIVIIGPNADAITADTPPSDTGIRWDPQGAGHVLLAGDETAVPAISSILEDLPPGVTGHAFLEVPDAHDVGTLTTASSVRVTWLPRSPADAARGELLLRAVNAAVETAQPPYSPQTYAWVAAEAGTVKSLRRHLVSQIGLGPRRSEFRAYWSLGKAGSGGNGTPVDPAAVTSSTH